MLRFPRGTVTFLCATMAASNGWTAHLRTAVTSQGGVVFYAGESRLQAVFSSPFPALQAALQAQRHILAAEAGATHLLPAMALNTGRTYERDGQYFGPTLNRVLSMLAAAHPGQVLLSASVSDALQGGLPAEVQIEPLGEYRLKDLLGTAQLYQVVAPGLPNQFPALHTLDVRPHNLPIQDSPLIGREQEVATTCALLCAPATRLLTLLGSSGMGKTRLALQVAVEVIDHFPDGVYFVALAPVSDPTLLVSMIAQVLGVKEQRATPLLETLTGYLHTKHMLLVLDNFEQLLAATPTISQLLAATPHITMLVTSQVVLDLEGEQVFAVPPLAMPDSTEKLSVDALSQIPAVALFVERARETQPSFIFTEALAPAVIELCTRLEGLPLAIELVAAQSKRYFPGDMVVMLQSRLNMARATRRGNTREDTLRPVLDWICEVLGSGVTGLFARLGIFAGGCTTESARAICNPTNDLALDVDQALTVLLDNHLLLREELKEGHARYTMLDAIHDYAHQRLTKRREMARLQNSHASYYTTLAETAEPLLKSAEQQTWLARLEDEHHNLRAALSWTLAEQPELALRLSGALARFWYMHGHYTEGRQWIQAALDQAPSAPPVNRAKALNGLGMLAYVQSDYAIATSAYEASLVLRRELDETAGIAAALNNLGIVAAEQGQYERATSLYKECLSLWRRLGDTWGTATTLNNLGLVLFNQGEFDRASACYQECVGVWENAGDKWGMAVAFSNLGRAACYQGDYDQATEVLSRGLNIAQEMDDQRVQSRIFEYQARVSLAQGDLITTRRLLTDCLRLRQRLGEKYELVVTLEVLADLLIAEGLPGEAPKLLGAAAVLRQALGTPTLPIELIQIEATTAAALAEISQPAFDAAWQAGAAMALDDLIDQVLDAPLPDSASP